MAGLIVNIDVPDLAAGRRFYCEGLGFAFQRLLFEATVAELRHGEVAVFLIERSPGSQPIAHHPARRDYGAHWTPIHLDVVVTDLGGALRRAVAAGASAEAEIGQAPWGRIAPLRDPFGHGVCLVEFSAAGYDAVETPGD